MNIVDTIRDELEELNVLQNMLQKRLQSYDYKNMDDWIIKEVNDWKVTCAYDNDVKARQRALKHQLHGAIARQHHQRRAWRSSHPTLASIWPKGAVS